MNWAQYTYLALVLVSLGISLATHGQPNSGRKSFWTTAIATAITLWLLYEGGFFAGAQQ